MSNLMFLGTTSSYLMQTMGGEPSSLIIITTGEDDEPRSLSPFHPLHWRGWASLCCQGHLTCLFNIDRVLNKMEEFTYELCSYQRRKVGTCIRYDCCTVVSCRPLSGCCRFSWFPWPVFHSWLPVFFFFCYFTWCCSESEDSVINLRIQHSNCLWSLFLLSFTCTLSSSHVSMHYTLSITVCNCTPC